MTRLILPVAIFRGDSHEPEWSYWDCVCDIEQMPVVWDVEYPGWQRTYVFAEDLARTEEFGQFGEPRNVVLTPFVSHENFHPEHILDLCGFKEASWNLRWDRPDIRAERLPGVVE